MDEIDPALYQHQSGTPIGHPNVYVHDNIVYKITHPGEILYSEQIQNKDKADPYKSLKKWKLYSRQFLNMDVMFDALFLLSKVDSKEKLRAPLAASIDYKGFRCLAIGKI